MFEAGMNRERATRMALGEETDYKECGVAQTVVLEGKPLSPDFFNIPPPPTLSRPSTFSHPQPDRAITRTIV